MIKQLLNLVAAKYSDKSVSRRSIICLSLRPRQIIDQFATDKLRYFARPRPIIVKYFNSATVLHYSHYAWVLCVFINPVQRAGHVKWAIPFNIHRPSHPFPVWMELSEGVAKVISEGATQSASFDLAVFFWRVQHKMPFFLRRSRKLGLFLRGVLCRHFDLLFLWG